MYENCEKIEGKIEAISDVTITVNLGETFFTVPTSRIVAVETKLLSIGHKEYGLTGNILIGQEATVYLKKPDDMVGQLTKW